MTNKFGVAGFLLGIIALVVGGIAVFQPNQIVTVQPTQPLGGGSSQYHTNPEYFLAGFSVGGGFYNWGYATTTSWDSGALAGGTGAQGFSTSSHQFIMRPAGLANRLPGVGDTCTIGNESASSTKAEAYEAKITAVDETSGFRNASATLTYTNYGLLQDYGIATLNWSCWNQ